MKPVLSSLTPPLVLLLLSACSSNGPAPDTGANPASAAGGSHAGAASTPSGAAGTTPNATNTASPNTGTSAAAAGSGGTRAAAGAAGAKQNAAGAAAGASGAAAGAAGSNTQAGAGAIAGAAGANSAGAGAAAPSGTRPPAISLKLPVTMESGGADPWFNIYRPMDLSATGQPLPIIAWANGGCYRSDFTWAPIFNRWAAAGFVVLALTESPTDGALAMTGVEDQGKLIDWAFKQAELQGGPYAGKLDTKRVVAAGNSCGGVTALGLAAKDKRVTAVFVLSGSSALGDSDKAVMGAISVPVGYVVGSPDEDVANGPANMDYGLLPEGVPAMVVNRSTGDHLTVSTDEKVLPQDAEISLNWIDLALYGTKEAEDALTSMNVCSICDAGAWKLKSKNFEKLRR